MNTCYNPFSLEGKRILVTGASSGIGRRCAIDCAKMGASVIISGRNEERLKQTAEEIGNCQQIVADQTDPDGLSKIIDSIDKLDGVVLSAGIVNTLPIQFSDINTAKKIFEVNFFSTAELVRVLYKRKKLVKNSSVVLIDSIGGVTSYAPGNGIYGSSKAALNSFMIFAAREFAQRKVRVNCVCPGMINTPLIQLDSISEEQLHQDMMRYPLGRYGEPEDVSKGVIYLLSDAASWVTGTNLIIDGGISIC